MPARLREVRRRFAERASIHHQRFLTDVLLVAALLFTMGCLWFTVGRWVALGALLMFIPKLITDGGRLLDVEVVRDRLKIPPGRHGKHSGKHPRPGARNRA